MPIRLFTWSCDYDGFGAIIVKPLPALMMMAVIWSPLFVFPFLMCHPPPLCYVLYAFWITWFFSAVVLTAVLGYIKEESSSVKEA